jgi:hypothetical protein
MESRDCRPGLRVLISEESGVIASRGNNQIVSVASREESAAYLPRLTWDARDLISLDGWVVIRYDNDRFDIFPPSRLNPV